VGVDHDGGDIRVPKQFLNRADVVACFEQMRGKGVAQRMATPEINKGLRLFDIKVRTVGSHPVLLQASLKSVPESLNRHRLVCTFFGHNSQPFQIVTNPSTHSDRQKKYIMEHGYLVTD
jgi:hypothetical protein